jgi:hypothetical protein
LSLGKQTSRNRIGRLLLSAASTRRDRITLFVVSGDDPMGELHRETMAYSAEMLAQEQRLDAIEAEIDATLSMGTPEYDLQQLLLTIQRTQLSTDRRLNRAIDAMNGLAQKFLIVERRVDALEAD